MSKELEALERLKTAPTFMGGTSEYQACTKSETLLLQDYEIVKQALNRLEAIDNAIEICKKANEQKYVYIKEPYGIIKSKFLDDLDYEILNNRLYVNSRGMYYNYPLKDYGNWWALTKEELENE